MDAHSVEFTTRIDFAFDVEELVYEVNTCLNAASMINRIINT